MSTSGGQAVGKLTAGTNVTLTPASGTGKSVKVTSTGGGGGSFYGQGGVWVPTEWYPVYAGTLVTTVVTNNEAFWVPLAVNKTVTTKKIGVNVTVKITTSVIRMAIYGDSGTGKPKALKVTAGTVAAGSTGLKTITVAEALTPGLYWLAVAHQVAVGAMSLKGWATTTGIGGIVGSVNAGQTGLRQAWKSTAVTGAFPATAPATVALIVNAPAVQVQMA